ncbi:hypothetical protein M407DRAFT_5132 [Tulasnella calospora MUT 4182]|uniref:Uncharacterized protein n=1 Tax=Tulasnella calospora MUT 4182 TaxID=1051891 RepID=A0A0C3QT83_9AGAM|nr:hypothetical protein M407DRAFT_5132 [Tulasnella calospora MUT 4182]
MSTWESDRNEIRELMNEAYDEVFKPSKDWKKDVEAVVRLDDYLWLNLIAQDMRDKGIDLDKVRKVDQIAERILGEADQATRDEDITTAMSCWSENTVDLDALTLSHDPISGGLSSSVPTHNPKEVHPSTRDEPSHDGVSSSSSRTSCGIKDELLKPVDSQKERCLHSYESILTMSSILSMMETFFILLVSIPEPDHHVLGLFAKLASPNGLTWLACFAVTLNIGCSFSSHKVIGALQRVTYSDLGPETVLGPAWTFSGEAGLTGSIDADGSTRLLMSLSKPPTFAG